MDNTRERKEGKPIPSALLGDVPQLEHGKEEERDREEGRGRKKMEGIMKREGERRGRTYHQRSCGRRWQTCTAGPTACVWLGRRTTRLPIHQLASNKIYFCIYLCIYLYNDNKIKKKDD